MKFFVFFVGLLFAVGFAQDTFFVNKSIGLSTKFDKIGDDSSTGTIVSLNDNVYALILVENGELAPGFEGTQPTSSASVLINLNTSKFITLGEKVKAENGVLFPRSLSTDGEFLYASLLRNNVDITIKDPLNPGDTMAVSSILYKISINDDKDFKIEDRAGISDNIVAFSGCFKTSETIFMLKTTSDKDLVINTKNGNATLGEFSKNVVFVSKLFEKEPTVIHTFSFTDNYIFGSTLTIDSSTFVHSHISDSSILTEFIRNNKVVSSNTSSLSYDSTHGLDRVDLVRIDDNSFVSVFTTEDTKICPDITDKRKIVFIKHQIDDEKMTTDDPVCIGFGEVGTNFFKNSMTHVVPQVVDDKIIIVTPYSGFGFDFCGTKLFTTVTSEGFGAMAVISVDLDTLKCLSVQTIDPASNQQNKGITWLSSVDENGEIQGKLVLLESYKSPVQTENIMRSVIFDYVRCEDGTIDYKNKLCVCFVGGKKCPSHHPVPPSPISSDPCDSSSDSNTDSSSDNNDPSSGHASNPSSGHVSNPSSGHASNPSSGHASNPSSGHVSNPSSVRGGSSGSKSSSNGCHHSSSNKRSTLIDSSLPAVSSSERSYLVPAAVLLGLTAAFLIASVVFIVLFFVL